MRLKWGCMTCPKTVAGNRGKAGSQLTGDVSGILRGRKRATKTTEHGIEDSKDVAHEKGHDALGKEVRRRVAAVEGRVEALRRDRAQGTEAGHAGAGPSQAEADGSERGASGMGRKPPPKPRLRREYPDLVTLEPAPDDEEVFGEAWPLIVEWRGLKDVHPNEGKGLSWLRTEERFLALELALLEDHGMTLPPARFPLRGFDRNGQVNWQQTALFDTRRAIRKRDLLNRLSFGLLWR